jgi:hypothetical protein
MIDVDIVAFLWRSAGLMMIFAFVVGQYALFTLPRIERGTSFWQVVALFWTTYRQAWAKVLPHPLFWGGAGLYTALALFLSSSACPWEGGWCGGL